MVKTTTTITTTTTRSRSGVDRGAGADAFYDFACTHTRQQQKNRTGAKGRHEQFDGRMSNAENVTTGGAECSARGWGLEMSAGAS